MRADFLTIVLCNSTLISEFSGPDAGVSRFMFRSAFLMVNDLFEPLSDFDICLTNFRLVRQADWTWLSAS